MGIKGAILGDICGSRWEARGREVLPKPDDDTPLFDELKHIKKEPVSDKNMLLKDLYSLSEPETEKYYFTDDTVLSIAVMEGCIHHTSDFTPYLHDYAMQYQGRGYGGAFSDWMYADVQVPYGSFGNGAAMRVGFAGQMYGKFFGKSRTEYLAAKTAMPTHNHREGVKGAVTAAVIVWMLENGKNKEDVLRYGMLQYPSVKYRYGCDRPLSEYFSDVQFAITCQDAVPLSIRLFYETGSFEECMRLVRSQPCDTDTIGAIAGSFCESFYKKTVDNEDDLLRKYLTDDLYGKLQEGLRYLRKKR